MKVSGVNMYELRSRKVMLKYKYDRLQLEQKLIKLNTMVGFADLVDTLFIKA